MIRRNPWQSYRRVATETAPPGQLVLMLFDGALRFLDLARTGFSKDDPLEFNLTIHENVVRAQAIISELNASLDMKSGGEFADNMRALYNYLDNRLDESNRRKDQAGIDEVVLRLSTLRDAWSEMLCRTSDGSPESQRAVEVGALRFAAAV